MANDNFEDLFIRAKEFAIDKGFENYSDDFAQECLLKKIERKCGFSQIMHEVIESEKFKTLIGKECLMN